MAGAVSAPHASAQYARVPARDSAAADSLATRLRHAEEAIAILQQQLGEQAAQAGTTRSRMRFELSGRALLSVYHNERAVNNVDNPALVRPDAVSALPLSSFGMTARQTTLGLAVFADSVLGGRFTGDVDVDFYGGQQPTNGNRTFPLIRLRVFRGIVRWTNGELLIGQETPLISNLNPVSIAAVGSPLFGAAGNLWFWLPQVRGSIDLPAREGSTLRFGAQAAVLANLSGDAVGLFDTDADPAERTGRPALQGRLRARWGDDPDHPSEIGCGPHLSWVFNASNTMIQSSGAACDARIALGARLTLLGEAYSGRALRGLGGGGIGQNFGRDGSALRDTGGWAQLNVVVASPLRAGVGCGTDRPDQDAVAVGGRLRNSACAAHLIARPAGPLFLGLEMRRQETTYSTGTFRNHHLALGTGFEF
ncbi:MAG: hypothetical protein H0W68_02985 [Gemmatimonadaceae bacterium]|nr:hypothetical protein [Gemmatimonadaceae bacterium]